MTDSMEAPQEEVKKNTVPSFNVHVYIHNNGLLNANARTLEKELNTALKKHIITHMGGRCSNPKCGLIARQLNVQHSVQRGSYRFKRTHLEWNVDMHHENNIHSSDYPYRLG